MKPLYVIFLAWALLASCPEVAGQAWHDVKEMEVEMLPDLNVPRHAHTLAYVGGELTVIGGHTTGFIPTATAEYYSDGKWHLLDTFFPHDFGFGVVMPSEEVLVGGGCAGPFGEGQTPGVELYNPAAHTFTPLPIMDQRRARPGAALLSDGTVVVSGNWYYADYISTYAVPGGPTTIRRALRQQVSPLILQTAPDNAAILSAVSAQNEEQEPMVERLHGDMFEVPLLREWEGWTLPDGCRMEQLFIGDETVGGYAWLFPAIRKADGQPGVIKVIGEEFSVLETEQPLPRVGPDGEELYRYPYLLADRARKCAWLVHSVPGKERMYVIRVDYETALRGGKAPVTLYRADLPEGVLAPVNMNPVLLPGGRIAIAGGLPTEENYYPAAAAFILHTEQVAKTANFPWPVLLILFCLLGGWGLFLLLRKPGARRPEVEAVPERSDLLTRITDVVEQKRLYLVKDLKIADIARELGTNATYISACINGQLNVSFPEFIARYRVEYAQKLMREHPELPSVEVWEESGFNNEKTFFRCFRAQTGMSPAEWKKSAGH